uniref:Nucleolar pre-ribosomal-associated protein 1 n=1 Tax=Timema tahoe TaxID=61484 RepID=A0A7R9IEU9_9NEOP|nr:unnamed protein product [Timema tahoe]
MTTKKRKSLANNDVAENDTPAEKRGKYFSANWFRDNLYNGNEIKALKSFLEACKNKEEGDVVGGYFAAGGDAMEIIKLLDRKTDKINLLFTVPLLSVLNQIIVSEMRSGEELHRSTEAACRQLLYSHLDTVHFMLGAEASSHSRRTILTLLAAMVTANSQLAKEVLAHVNFPPSELKQLTTHRKPQNKNNTRTCFIRFIMAFLIGGDVHVIKLLTDKKDLLISVIPGLVYDHVATVTLVLSTLRTQLLENTHITKTRKMNVFNTSLVHNLLALYDWIGPDGHWSTVKNKLKKNSLGNEDDKQLVGLALHRLLLVLCTSHKYGVIFHDKSIGTSGKKYNELIETVLEFMNQPWEDELRRELTLKILVTCPDLFRNFVTRIHSYLKPRNSISWFKTVKFLKEVISSMNAEAYLKSQDSSFSQDQLTSMIKNLTVPSTVLRMARKAILTPDDMDVCYILIELLLTMLNGLHSFMSSLEKFQLLSQRDLEDMKATIQTYLMENSPTGEALLLAWEKATSHPKAKTLAPTQQSHPLALLDLLSLLHQCCPQLLDTDTFDSRTFLSDVQRVFSGEEDEAKHVIKALQLLVAIDKLTFAPGKTMFEPTLSLLLSLLGSSSCTPAHMTLCSLLWETGLFEGSEVEMLVWLHCYMAISQEHRAEVARILVQAVTHVATHTGMYLDMVTKATELAKEDDWTSRLDVDNIFDELMEVENITQESYDYQPAPSAVTLGPLLPGFLHVATEHLGDNEPSPELINFSSYVVVHLLHSQISSSTLYHIVAEFSMLLPSSVLTYVQGWLPKSSPVPLKKPFKPCSPERKLSKALLSLGESSIHNVFEMKQVTTDNHINGINENSKAMLLKNSILNDSMDILSLKDPVHLMLLFKESLFYLCQLISQGNLVECCGDGFRQAFMYLLLEMNKTQIEEGMSLISFNPANVKRRQNSSQGNLLGHCFKHTFMHPTILYSFSPVCSKKYVSNKLPTELVLHLVEIASRLIKDETLLHFSLQPIRHKFINLITVWFKGYSKNKIKSHATDDLLRLVDLLQLDIKDIVSLLELMAPVPTDLLVSSLRNSNSICTLMSPLGSLLSHLLSRAGIIHQLSSKKVGVILQNTVESVSEHLIVLEKRTNVDVTPLERGLLEFLESFPHHLAYVSKGLLNALLKHPKPQLSTIKLATFLVERNKQFISVFESQASKTTSVIETPELLFPVLSAALAHGSDTVNEDFLKSVYNYYITNIHEAVIQITKTPDWLKQNSTAIVLLVERFMESDTSKRLYEHLQTKQASRTYDDLYVLLLKKIFDNVKSQNIALDENPRVLQTEIFLDMLLKMCKQKSQDMKQVTDLATAICECVDSAEETDVSWKSLKKSITWTEFRKLALKLGLAKKGHFMLLDVMSKLCEVLYRDGCREEQVVTLFQMVLSHSQFFNVVIGSASNKCSVIQLLLVLVKKAPSLMTSAHVPVLLGAYNASLSTSDQLILRLLKSYEHAGVSLHECRPYLWGEAAVNHYSVRSDLAQSLWRQPNIEQVLDLLTADNLATTLKYFPLNRNLEVCEKLHADAPNTYDPAFLLPLFSHLLAPENLSRTFRFHRRGALALTLACLGSNCENVRQAAFHVIARFYFHLEASTGSDKKVWVQFINAIGGGICQISDDVQSVQPPYIVALFLARASLHVSNPLHPMFAPLHNYISLKSALNLTTVPEFLALFHSSDLNYRVHRHFILEVLRDGMKQKDDFEISHKNVIYKILLSFYSSVIADKKSKLLILEIVESSVKIPEAAPLLVSSYGILSWLEQIIQLLKPGDEHVNAILHILASLWNTLVNSSSSSKNNLFSDVSHHTLLLLLDLFTKFNLNMSPKELEIYLGTVYKVLSLQNCGKVVDAMTFTHMTSILHFSKEILGSNEDCEDLLRFGYQFYKISSEDVKEKDDFVLARYNLRRLTIEWLNQTRKSD